MDELNVDFQLEVLEGCGARCRGCHVDKRNPLGLSSKELSNLRELFCDFQDRGYRLDHLIIGPTDFSTAGNFDDLAANEDLSHLTSFFGTTNWTTTLEAPDWQSKVKKVAAFNRSAEATFSFVVNPQRVFEPGYLERIRSRSIELATLYGRTIRRFYVVFNASPNQSTDAVNLRTDYLAAHRRVTALFPVPTFDHGISFSRAERIDQQRTPILRTMRWLNSVYDSIADQSEIPIEFLNPGDYTGHRYVYRRGEFYWAPLWYEPFICFDEAFRVQVESFKVSEFADFERKILLQQYEVLGDSVCEPCDFNAVCLRRGIVHLRTALKEPGCIAPKGALESRGLVYQ